MTEVSEKDDFSKHTPNGNGVKTMYYDSEAQSLSDVPPEPGLKRQLENRHVAMIRYVHLYTVCL